MYLLNRRPPRSPLFPYTTLFRSLLGRQPEHAVRHRMQQPHPQIEHRGLQLGGIVEAAEHETLLRQSRRGTAPTLPSPACRSEEHTSELQSHVNLVCRLLLEKKKQ